MQNGLYRHYKNGNLYRLLFTAAWQVSDNGASGEAAQKELKNNDDVYVYVYNSISSPSIGAGVVAPWDDRYLLLTSKWSGNLNPGRGDLVAIYVAIYEEGRLASRSLSEFNSTVEYEGATVQRFQRYQRVE